MESKLISWNRAVKGRISLNNYLECLECQEQIAVAIEEVYHCGLDNPRIARPPNLDKIRLFRNTCFQTSSTPWKEAESTIKSSIIPAVQTILSSYKNPLLIIKKRDAKRLDFERASTMKTRGDTVFYNLLISKG